MKRVLLALLALVVLFFGVRAIVRAFASDETKIRWVVEDMAEGFNDTRMNPILAGLDPQFRDETSGFEREDLRAGLAQIFLQRKDPQTKKFPYRVALPEEEIKIAVLKGEPRTAEMDLLAVFEQSQGEAWQTAWKARVHAELTLLPGGWRIKRTTSTDVEGKRLR